MARLAVGQPSPSRAAILRSRFDAFRALVAESQRGRSSRPARESLHEPASMNSALLDTSAERSAMSAIVPGGALAILRAAPVQPDPREIAASGSGWAREVFRSGPGPRHLRDTSRHTDVPANFPRKIPPAPRVRVCDTAKLSHAGRPRAVASQAGRRVCCARSPADRKTPTDSLVPERPTPAAGSHARSPDHHGERELSPGQRRSLPGG